MLDTVKKIKGPNFTQIPNVILDNISTFTPFQFTVLIHICRRTFGWSDHQGPKRIRISSIVERTGISDGCVKSSLRDLVARGFLLSQDNSDETGSRLPNTYSINAARFPKKKKSDTPPGAGDAPPPPGAGDAPPWGDKCPTLGQQMPGYIGTKENCIKERVLEINENQKTTLIHSQSNSTPINPEDSGQEETKIKTPVPPPAADFEKQSSSYDLQLSDDVNSFVKNAYRQSRGAKITNAELKRFADRIESAQSSCGPEEFRLGLWLYLASSSTWLRENKWPVAAFLKDPSRYSAEFTAPADAPTTPKALPAGDVSSSTSANAPAAQSPSYEKIPVGALQYVDIWDTLIPERPVGELLVITRKKLEQASREPDFVKSFTAICETCKGLIASGQPTKFSWLFIGDRAQNWQAVLEGKFDWLIKPLSAVDQLIANAEREERELANA